MKNRLLIALVAWLGLVGPAAAYTLTPLLNLKKPVPYTETGWPPMLNDNADILDNAAIANGTGINGRIAVFSAPSIIGPSSFAQGSIVLLTGAQTLTDKQLDSAVNTLKIAGVTITGKKGNSGLLQMSSGTLVDGNLAKFDSNGNVVDSGLAASASASAPFSDAGALVKNSSDATKLARFSLAGLTTGVTRVYSLPDVTGDTVALIAAAQTFTNKTYNAGVGGNVFSINSQALSTVSGNTSKVGTVSGSPTSFHLLKADASGNIADSGVDLRAVSGNTTTAMTKGAGTLTAGNALTTDASGNVIDGGAAGGAPFADNAALVKNNTDNTKRIQFSAAGISTASTRVLTAQNRDGTLADLGANIFTAEQTLDNQKGLRLRETTANGTNYIELKAPTSIASNRTLTPQDRDGTIADLGANIFIDNQVIDNQKAIRLRETTANGTNYTGLKAPASLSADLEYVMPSAYPTSNGQALTSTTGGTMSWATAGGGGGGKTVVTFNSGDTNFDNTTDNYMGVNTSVLNPTAGSSGTPWPVDGNFKNLVCVVGTVLTGAETVTCYIQESEGNISCTIDASSPQTGLCASYGTGFCCKNTADTLAHTPVADVYNNAVTFHLSSTNSPTQSPVRVSAEFDPS
jgi:hypothetical protein